MLYSTNIAERRFVSASIAAKTFCNTIYPLLTIYGLIVYQASKRYEIHLTHTKSWIACSFPFLAAEKAKACMQESGLSETYDSPRSSSKSNTPTRRGYRALRSFAAITSRPCPYTRSPRLLPHILSAYSNLHSNKNICSISKLYTNTRSLSSKQIFFPCTKKAADSNRRLALFCPKRSCTRRSRGGRNSGYDAFEQGKLQAFRARQRLNRISPAASKLSEQNLPLLFMKVKRHSRYDNILIVEQISPHH